MLHKVVGAILIGLAVWLWLRFSPGNAESRKDLKKMLISIAVVLLCVVIAGLGIQIFTEGF